MAKIYSPGSHFYRIYEERLAMQGLKLLGVFAEGFIGVGSTRAPENAGTAGDKGLDIARSRSSTRGSPGSPC